MGRVNLLLVDLFLTLWLFSSAYLGDFLVLFFFYRLRRRSCLGRFDEPPITSSYVCFDRSRFLGLFPFVFFLRGLKSLPGGF